MTQGSITTQETLERIELPAARRRRTAKKIFSRYGWIGTGDDLKDLEAILEYGELSALLYKQLAGLGADIAGLNDEVKEVESYQRKLSILEERFPTFSKESERNDTA